MRLTEKLQRLRRAVNGSGRVLSGQRDRQAPPCVGCHGQLLDRLEPVETPALAASTTETVVQPVRGLQQAAVENSLVALDPASGRRVLLNPTAALIFTAVTAPRSVGDLVAQIADETGARPETVTADVIATVDRLVSQGMLVRDDLDWVEDDEAGASETHVSGPGESSVTERVAPVATAEPDDAERRSADDPTAGISWAYDTGPRDVAGTTVAVRVEPPVLVDEVRSAFEALPSVASPAAAKRPQHRVEIVQARPVAEALAYGDGTDHEPGSDERVQIIVDGTVRATRSDPRGALGDVFDQLDGVLADHAPGLRFHAGAVERDGRVIVIGGQSGAGKSSLTAALVARGFAYLTDELVVVDPETWQVAPYPRPLDLDGASCATLGLGDADFDVGRGKAKVLPTRVGDVSAGGRVALVVLLTAEPTSNEHTDQSDAAETMPAPEAVMALVAVTFGPAFDDPDALEHLADLCTTVPVLRMTRSPLEAMVSAVEQGFGAA